MRWYFLTHLNSLLCAHVRVLCLSLFHQLVELSPLQNLGLPLQIQASILYFLNEAMKGPFDQSTLSSPPRVAQLSPFHRLALMLIGCHLGKATPLSAWFLYTLMGTQSTINLRGGQEHISHIYSTSYKINEDCKAKSTPIEDESNKEQIKRNKMPITQH